ncbi:MAG: hypothetical protein JWN17_266 [Frankiales bacterium]|nr:hypothetical protein [Frankiales bacterium]
MTTTSTHPAQATSLDETRASQPGRPLLSRPLALAAAAGPALFLGGQSLVLKLPHTLTAAYPQLRAHRDRLTTEQLLTALGCALFLATALAVLRLARIARRPGRGWLAAVLLAAGALGDDIGELTSAYTQRAATAPGVSDAAGTAVLRASDHLGALSVLSGPASIPVLILGLLLSVVALWGARPRWAAPAVLAGAVLGVLVPVPALGYLTSTVVAVGFGAWMLHGHRTPYTDGRGL